MIIKQLVQTLLEWHCILEHHIWITRDNKTKHCMRCCKIREPKDES